MSKILVLLFNFFLLFFLTCSEELIEEMEYEEAVQVDSEDLQIVELSPEQKEFDYAIQLIDKALESEKSITRKEWVGGKPLDRVDSNNLEKAISILKKSDETGSMEAKLILAKLIFFGYSGNRSVHSLNESFYMFKDIASSNGNDTAHYLLGLFYAYGLGGVEVNVPLSLVHLHVASRGGHPFSELALGFRAHFGISVEQSHENSVKFYKQASLRVAMGLRDGPYDNALPYPRKITLAQEQGGVFGPGASGSGSQESESSAGHATKEDIIQFYQHNADRGDAQSQLVLGQVHYYGTHNVKKNYDKAIFYFKKAASRLSPSTNGVTLEGGDSSAQAAAFLGLMYLRGEGLKQENSTAFRWFRKSAEYGNPMALYYLGLMQYKGIAVKKNIESATKLFVKAAERNYAEAFTRLGIIAVDQSDYETASKHFFAAFKQSNLLAMSYLGVMYDEGKGLKRNPLFALVYLKAVAERGDFDRPLITLGYEAYKAGDIYLAFMRYLIAADMGYDVAQSNLAWIIEKGEYSFGTKEENYYFASLWWNRAAIQGHVDARVKMGDYYYLGKGVKVDHKMAANYYQVAEMEQSSIAMFYLGYMYENGIGVDLDFHMAKRYYTRALETNPEAVLPVNLALIFLRVKYFFHWIRHGGNFFLDAPADRENSKVKARKSDEFDDSNRLLEDLIKAEDSMVKSKKEEDAQQDQFSFGDDFVGESDNEMVFLAGLVMIAVFLIWARQNNPVQRPLNPNPNPEQRIYNNNQQQRNEETFQRRRSSSSRRDDQPQQQ